MTQQQATMFDALTCDPMELIDQLGDDVDLRKWPERLHQLFEILRAFNLRRGMSADQASLDARDRCILIGDYLGGRPYNLPRGDALRIALRDKQIFLEFTGANHEELADRYGLDVTHIYRILRQQRRLYQAKLQGQLFNNG